MTVTLNMVTVLQGCAFCSAAGHRGQSPGWSAENPKFHRDGMGKGLKCTY